jgi:hypothetical protein
MLDNKSYSLIELSISLTIVTLLITSGATIFAKKSEIDKIKITRERMDIIERAIVNYVDLNGFIPCPATGSSVENDAYFGDSQTNASYNSATHVCSNNTTSNVGMVPIRNLGLEDKYAYDGWGRKFSFQIGTGMGNAVDFSDLNYRGDLDVVDHNGVNITNRYAPIPNNYGAAYVIVSFGQDGIGAWSRNITTTPTSPTSTNVEYNNSLYLSGGNSYGSNIYIKDTSSTNFNHLVTFQTKPMLTSPKLGISPIKIPRYMCDDASAIATAGFPLGSGFNPLLLGASSVVSKSIGGTSYAPSNASLPAQIYLSAIKTQKLCNNPPVATYNVNSNSASSCNFSPKAISGLTLWLDGNDPNATGVQVSATTPISTWKDKSGNGYNATSSGTAPQASYDLGFPNSKILVNFIGTGYYTSTLTLPASTSMSVFIVKTIGSGQMLYFGSGACYFGENATAGSGFTTINFFVPNVTTIPQPTYYGSTSYDPVLLNAIINGATTRVEMLDLYNIYSSFDSANTSFSCSAGNYQLFVGANNTGASKYQGKIAEILIYQSNLSPGNYKALQGYLTRKWFSGECP